MSIGRRLTIPESAAAPAGLRRVLANLAHLLGGKAAAAAMSLVYLVIVARTLGARDYGVLVLVNGYAVLMGSVLAFSGFHGVVRYGAIALAAGDRAGLAAIVRFMAVVELGCGLGAIVLTAALAPLVGPRLGWSPATIAIAVPYSLAVLGTVRATPQGVLQVAGRFDLVGLHQTVSPVVRLIGTLGVWLGGGGLTGFLIVWLLSSLAEGVAMWALAWPSWRRLAVRAPLRGGWRGVPAANAGLGRFILVTNFDLTLRELAPNLAPLTVGWLLGPAAAGVLALAQRATSLFQQPGVLLGQASYAVLAEQAAKGALATLRQTVWRSAGLALVVATPLLVLLALFGERLLVLIGGGSFGDGAMGGRGLLPLVAGARVANLTATPFAAGLSALGRPQRSMAVTLAASLGLYPVLPLLLVRFGIVGAGWHMLGQSLAAAVALALYFARDSQGAAPQ